MCHPCLPVVSAGCKEEEFTWTNYLRMTKAQVAPKELFASPGRVSATPQYDSWCAYELQTPRADRFSARKLNSVFVVHFLLGLRYS